ncbi:hypothetical protein BH11ACT8_BH11ACT8_01590 [soil metagenome]
MSSQQALLDRYGAPAPWRRPALIATIAVVVLAFGGWLAWTVWEQSSPPVASGELTFEIVGENTASARFVIDLRDPDVEATCTLRAYAEDHTLVGLVSFTPEPSAGGVVQRDISTDRRATSVELLGCTAPGQPRPR